MWNHQHARPAQLRNYFLSPPRLVSMGAVLIAVSVEPPEHVPGLLRFPKSRRKLSCTTAEQESAPQDPPCQLRSNLFIGSADTEAALSRAAAGSSISHILQVGVELQPTHPQQFRYAQLACSDTETQDIVGLFSQAFQFIDEGRNNGGELVVHFLLASGESPHADVSPRTHTLAPRRRPNTSV